MQAFYCCETCGRTFNSRVDFYSHESDVHGKVFDDEELEAFHMYRCPGEGCKKFVPFSSKVGFCRSCRQKGAANPVHNMNMDMMKLRTQQTTAELWKDEAYRSKVITGVSKPRREGFKQEQSDRIKQWYKDNPEQRAIRSEHMKQSWKSGVLLPGQGGFTGNRSKVENELYDLLKDEWGIDDVSRDTLHDQETGKYFFPDVLYRGHYVIEFFGNYWHANPAMYAADDIVNGTTAQEIWDKDETRINAILSMPNIGGVWVIWEKDYMKAKQEGTLKNLIYRLECSIEESINV